MNIALDCVLSCVRESVSALEPYMHYIQRTMEKN